MGIFGNFTNRFLNNKQKWNEKKHNREQSITTRINKSNPLSRKLRIGPKKEDETNDKIAEKERHLSNDVLKAITSTLDLLPPFHTVGNCKLDNIGQSATPIFSKNKNEQIFGLYHFDKKSITLIGNQEQSWFNYLLGELFTQKQLTRTVRHEIGHSVDNAINWTANKEYKEDMFGGWEEYKTPRDWANLVTNISIQSQISDIMIPATNSNDQATLDITGKWLANAIKALRDKTHMKKTINESTNPAFKANKSKKPLLNILSRAEKNVNKVIKESQSPPGAKISGEAGEDKNYLYNMYDEGFVSYKSEKWNTRNTNYQFAHPKEWFAESYAEYFTPQATEWGSRLKNIDARNWFRANLDSKNNESASLERDNQLISYRQENSDKNAEGI